MLLRRIVSAQPAAQLLARRMLCAAAFPPHTKVTLPALSPTMTEGGLATWKKKDGEAIKPGEVLCEIETDKATVDFEFQEDGVLAKTLVKEGTTGLKVGAVIAIMVEDAANVQAFASASFDDYNATATNTATVKPQVVSLEVEKLIPQPAAPPKQPGSSIPEKPAAPVKSETKQTAPSSAPERTGRVFASPLARRLAREQEKSLEKIKGTGPNGRILAADVQESKVQPQQAAQMGPGDQSWVMNKLNTPHYYLNVDVDLTESLAFCDTLNKARKDKTPISVNDFILKAAALAMRVVPEANGAWGDGGSFRTYDFCDVNLAISTPNGIVRSPLLKNIHSIGLEEICTRTKDFESKLSKNEEMDETPGTFSVINVGAYGVKSIVPIIRPGQTTALGVGAPRKVVIPIDTSSTGAKVATVATVTLSCDHRVVDGAIGAEWLHTFKALLEKPMNMLL